MYDLIDFGINKSDNSKTFKSIKDDDKMTVTIYSADSFKSGDILYNIPIKSNDNLLISNGIIVEDLPNDCFSLLLSFSQRKEDSLHKKRAEVFSKYFMFDESHIDMM